MNELKKLVVQLLRNGDLACIMLAMRKASVASVIVHMEGCLGGSRSANSAI